MKTMHYFEFDFDYRGKPTSATCYVYYHENSSTPLYNYPMYRVALKSDKYGENVYVFFEVNREDRRFVWHPLNAMGSPTKSQAALMNQKEEYAKSIAERLESFDYRKTDYEVVKKPFWAV